MKELDELNEKYPRHFVRISQSALDASWAKVAVRRRFAWGWGSYSVESAHVQHGSEGRKARELIAQVMHHNQVIDRAVAFKSRTIR